MFDGQAHGDEQVDAGQRRGAGAGGHQLDVLQALFLQKQRVEHGGGADDGGAVLVVMEDRNAHARPQGLFDIETLRRLDVLEVDRAEGRLQGRNHLDELVRIVGVHLDVEDVNAGELLEQYRLAFHHRLGRQRPDRAQAQDGGAIGDYRNQVASGGIEPNVVGVGGDRLAGRGHTRRIGQAQVPLGRHPLRRLDGQLPRPRIAVIVEGVLADVIVHQTNPDRWASGEAADLAGRANTVHERH